MSYERLLNFIVYLKDEVQYHHGYDSPVYNQIRGFIERETNHTQGELKTGTNPKPKLPTSPVVPDGRAL